jgi:aryl-alcohol dehydrogenase-like predicted oxidoreductase
MGVPETFDIGGEDTVNRLGFGAMRICGEDILGEPADVGRVRRVLERAVDLGVDFVDITGTRGVPVSSRT